MYIISIYRLDHFIADDNLQRCGENAGFGGKCLTQLDVEELWRLHREVRPLTFLYTVKT